MEFEKRKTKKNKAIEKYKRFGHYTSKGIRVKEGNLEKHEKNKKVLGPKKSI